RDVQQLAFDNVVGLLVEGRQTNISQMADLYAIDVLGLYPGTNGVQLFGRNHVKDNLARAYHTANGMYAKADHRTRYRSGNAGTLQHISNGNAAGAQVGHC